MSNELIIRRSGIPGPGSDALQPLVDEAQAHVTAAQGYAEDAAAEAAFVSDRKALRPAWALDWQLPSRTRPVKAVAVEANRRVFDLRPPNSAYRDGFERCETDVVRIEFMNLAKYHGLDVSTEQIWVITSIMSRFAGQWIEHVNYSWNELIGSSYNTGQIPSLFEPMQFVGLSTDSIGDINSANGSGPYHGKIDYSGLSFLVNGGIKLDTVIADGTQIRDTFVKNDVIEAASFSIQPTWTYAAPGGTVLINVTGEMSLNPGADYQLRMNFLLTYNATASQTTVGYHAMLPTRWGNTLEALTSSNTVFVGPDQGGDNDDYYRDVARQQLILRTDRSNITALTQCKKVSVYNTAHPTHRLELSLADSYAPFRRNGTPVAWDGDSNPHVEESIDNSPKVRFPTHQNSLNSTVETNNILSTLAYYSCVRADIVA